jgi:hypothetical protein
MALISFLNRCWWLYPLLYLLAFGQFVLFATCWSWPVLMAFLISTWLAINSFNCLEIAYSDWIHLLPTSGIHRNTHRYKESLLSPKVHHWALLNLKLGKLTQHLNFIPMGCILLRGVHVNDVNNINNISTPVTV